MSEEYSLEPRALMLDHKPTPKALRYLDLPVLYFSERRET